MNSKSKFAIGVLGLAILVLSNAKNSCAAPPTDACSLLTPAQVTSVLDIPATPGHLDPADKTVCHWPFTGLAGVLNSKKGVEVKLLDANSWSMLEPAIAAGESVTGVGDNATYFGPSRLTTLVIERGNVRFEVTVSGVPLDQVKAKEKTLAKDILAKL
jgi:hypothetical protein